MRDGKAPIELDDATRAKHKSNGLYLFELCKAGLTERYGTDYDAWLADREHASEADKLL